MPSCRLRFTLSLLLTTVLLSVTWGAHAQSAGAALFNGTCVACHGAGGAGIPGLAPPLAGALKAHFRAAQGRSYVMSVLLAGLSGPIESAGQKFNSAMPNLRLRDEQIADLVNHLQGELNQMPVDVAVTADDVAQVRATQPTASRNHALRKTVLTSPAP